MRILVDSDETLRMITAVYAAASKKEYPGNNFRELDMAEVAVVCWRSTSVEPPKKEKDPPKGKTE